MINPKEEIIKLQQGQKWIWPESDYGRAEIWMINNTYLLFAIPNYGGEPYFVNDYEQIELDNLISLVESWN